MFGLILLLRYMLKTGGDAVVAIEYAMMRMIIDIAGFY